MWKHFFTIAGRNLLRNRGYTLINLIGLGSGIAVCLIILLFIQFEWNYEGFHPENERLYRVVQQFGSDPEDRSSGTGFPMATNLPLAFPEIETAVRVHQKEGLIQVGQSDQRFREESILYADSTFFEVFGFTLLDGDVSEVLDGPGAVVLTEKMALKLFGKVDIIGEQLSIDEKLALEVTGIAANPPLQTDLNFDMVVNIKGLNPLYGLSKFESWWWPTVETYVKLGPTNAANNFSSTRAKAFVETYREPGLDIFPALQPIQDIHRHGNPGGEGSMRYILLFGIIGAVVLLIACVNFMNLATARAAIRVLEVGVKKAIGATRGLLIRQFLGESALLAGLAIVVGLGLAELLLPAFTKISGYSLTIPWQSPMLWLTLLGILVLSSLLSGVYPAFFMTRFSPLQALKQGAHSLGGGKRLRQGLVIFQFIISAILITATLLIQEQHSYMLSRDLGFSQEQVVVVELQDNATLSSYAAFKQAIKQVADVEFVSAASWAPAIDYAISFPASVENEFGEMVDIEGVQIIYVDYDFFEASGIQVENGRGFSRNFPADEKSGFVLNQAALDLMGTGPYIDRKVRLAYGEYGQTLYEKMGVVKGTIPDFHVMSLRDNISPTLITLRDENEVGYLSQVLIRMRPGNHLTTRSTIESIWENINPGYPINLYFANERLETIYAAEKRLGYLLGAFASIAILIAGLGLLGLAAYTAQQRTKEIGIRKVLGASTGQIWWLLQREFAYLVLIALSCSLPIAYWLGQEWLKGYAYKMGFSLWPFMSTAFILIAITWISIGLQSKQAAQRNPIDALRYE